MSNTSAVGAKSSREMVRVIRPGGKVAAYVWDYSGGMQMMRHFWDAAIETNTDDAKIDEAERPPSLALLDNERRDRIREVLRARLAVSADGSISLMARAWAVQETV